MSDLIPNVFNHASTTYATVKQILNEKMVATIGVMTNPLPVIVQNQIINKPTAGYIKFTVRQAIKIKDGVNSYETSGLATADVFVPLGTGYAMSTAVYEAVQNAFEDTSWAYNVLSTGRVTEVDVGETKGLYLTQIDIPFRFNTRK